MRTPSEADGPSMPERCIEVEGSIISGRGKASYHLLESFDELKSITNETLVPGSLNVVLKPDFD